MRGAVAPIEERLLPPSDFMMEVEAIVVLDLSGFFPDRDHIFLKGCLHISVQVYER
jgi:hypothetical protein